MIFGAHVSVAKGYGAALDYALSVGCECAQVFAKSPRQWNAPPIDERSALGFREERQSRGFGPVFTHTAYLINLSTDNEELRQRSILALSDELLRAAALGAEGVVTHIGNDPLGSAPAAVRRSADSVVRAVEEAGERAEGVRLLLENTAGAGRTFGSTVEEIAGVVDASGMGSDRLGMCFDTCHGFAHGYDLTCAAGWRSVLDSIDELLGIVRLGLIHANDCLFERGSRKDRHAWIGEGHIGSEGFRSMVSEPRLSHVAAITEMPGEVPLKDSVNLDRLKKFRGGV